MPRRDVLLDTGPLVGLLNPRDTWHEHAAAAWQGLADFCVTTEAVLAEACHMMLRGSKAAYLPLDVVLEGGIPVITLDDIAHRHASTLMRQYADLPMDYADASLVTVAEALGTVRVFTTDRRGFGVYRLASGTRFEIIP